MKLLRNLPTGFTASATVQVAGRGRGSNVWVSPAGSLMFSTCIQHPIHLTSKAPIVFLQYLAALAIVEGIKTYDKGYQDVPVKLKWPNDICESPTPSPFLLNPPHRLTQLRKPRRPRSHQIRVLKILRQNRRYPRQFALFGKLLPRRRRHRPQHDQPRPHHLPERPTPAAPAPLHAREAPCPHPLHL